MQNCSSTDKDQMFKQRVVLCRGVKIAAGGSRDHCIRNQQHTAIAVFAVVC